MKTLKFLLFALFLALVSCETEEIENQEENLIVAEFTTNTSNNSVWDDWDSQEFHDFLQGIGDLIGRGVTTDNDAAIEFNNIVQGQISVNTDGSVVVTLEDILSNSRSDLYKAIEARFFSDFCLGHPGGGAIDPYPPLGPNGAPINFESFVNYALNYHCLEVYLPFGLDTTNGIFTNVISEMLVTGHPLDLNTSNVNANGTIAYIFPEQNLGECDAYMNISTSNTYTNLLIVRPIPSFNANIGSYCSYSIYSTIDFTEYFEQ